MWKDFIQCGLRVDVMEVVQDIGFAVFDEFVRPADALDLGVDARAVEVVDAGRAEAVEQDVVFEGADDLGLAGDFFQQLGIKRFDETRIDESDRVALFFEQLFGLNREVEEGPETDEGNVFAFLDQFAFAELDGRGDGVDGSAVDHASWVTDGGRAFVVSGHPFEHGDEFRFVLRLHVDDVGDVSEITDIEQAVVGRAVVSRKSAAVHA